jgi:SAM-dependent methyltransferase
MRVKAVLSGLKTSLQTKGIGGSLRHYATILLNLATRYTPSGRRKHRHQRKLDAAFARKRIAVDKHFDSVNKVDTSGKIELSNLCVETLQKEHGTFYQAVFPDHFRNGIRSLNIDPQEFLFIDVGAGKGRALFLAQDSGFKRVVGIEFAKELVEICKRNMRLREGDGLRRPPVSIWHMDALQYELPYEPTVLFMFNPFNEQVMRPFIDRIHRQLRRAPRPFKIVYENPVCDQVVMSGIPGVRRLAYTQHFASYECSL